MTTKKPKAPATNKKTAVKPAQGGKKPSLSQQKRLKALRGTQVAPPPPEGRTEPPAGSLETLKNFRELRDDHEKALAARIPYPEPLGAVVDFKPYPSDLRITEPVEFYPQAKVGAPPLPAAQKRDTATDFGRLKKLLYAAIGVVALGVVVYYGGFL